MNVLDKGTNTWSEEYRAKRKPKTLDKMKSKVANCILNRANERNKIDELLRGTVRYKKDNHISLASFRKTNQLFTEARHRLRSEEHTSELQSRGHLVCRLLLEKKNTRP